MTAIDDVLRKVRDLDEAASPAPWFKAVSVVGFGSKVYVRSGTPGGVGVALVQDATRLRSENGDFMAASRTLLPRVAKGLGIAVEALGRLSTLERNPDSWATTALSAIEAALKEGE